MSYAIIGTIAPAQYGNVKAVTDPSAPYEIHVGNVYGIVRGIVKSKHTASEQIFYGLGGSFHVDRYNWETGKIKDSIRGGKLYFPSGMGEEMILAAQELKNGEVFRIALKFSTYKTSNPAGYSWKMQTLGNEQESDPLAEFRSMVAKSENIELPEVVTKPQLAHEDEASKEPEHKEPAKLAKPK